MVTEKLLSFGFTLLDKIMNIFHVDLSFSINTAPLDTFLDVVSVAAYFFPWRQIAPIFVIILIFMGFRISIALLKFALAFIPGLG